MNIVLFDSPQVRNALKPLVLTRPVSELRCGIFTISEKWRMDMNSELSFLTEDYLSAKFPTQIAPDTIYIHGAVFPSEALVQAIINLEPEQALIQKEQILAVRTAQSLSYAFSLSEAFSKITFSEEITKIAQLPHLYLLNSSQILADFQREISTRTSHKITDKFSAVYGEQNVFVGENVQLKAAIINAENGPVYIGDNAIIQEGAIIVGPTAIGHHAMVGYGAKIRPGTTLGPHCRVAGEVSNSILHEYSNKAHDGFLGNSYIGSWCNLGANTNNSNLKNNYKTVSLYSYSSQSFEDTQQTFCGTFMGDYSKAGISTMFNTGTVVGVCANVFGGGFQDKFVPSFSWGGALEGREVYRFDKAIEVIQATIQRKGLVLEEVDFKILKYISENS